MVFTVIPIVGCWPDCDPVSADPAESRLNVDFVLVPEALLSKSCLLACSRFSIHFDSSRVCDDLVSCFDEIVVNHMLKLFLSLKCYFHRSFERISLVSDFQFTVSNVDVLRLKVNVSFVLEE